MIITLCGFMGSGKSTVGSILAEKLGWEFIDLDAYVEHKKGMAPGRIIETEGEEAFRALEAECLRDVVIMHQLSGTDLVLALGGGTVTIGSVREIIFQQTSCVWLKAEMGTILERAGSDSQQRPLMSEERYEERIPLYSMARYSVETDGKSPAQVAGDVELLVCE